MGLVTTVALVTVLTRGVKDFRSHLLIMKLMSKIREGPASSWWVLGISMMVFSFFLWPSPSVALVGAVMLPYAIKSGPTPMAAAMAMNLFRLGIASSYFHFPGDSFHNGGKTRTRQAKSSIESSSDIGCPDTYRICSRYHSDTETWLRRRKRRWLGLRNFATFNMHRSFFGNCHKTLEKITEYITDGFLSAIRIFTPVILIQSFFLLGGEGITAIMGKPFQCSILNDWVICLALFYDKQYTAAFLQIEVSGLTGLDDSGFSSLPLAGPWRRP